MKLPNKYFSTCCRCGRLVPQQQGFLVGRDTGFRRWIVFCRTCMERSDCEKARPSVPGFFDQVIDEVELQATPDQAAKLATVET